ncbi:hypothetical protein [Xenorhabdus sp. KK7.4]|uniref:hypothetical protein n=1 Tax=Xenorhabdus sp. KK7.4 TaxID=1851572 RepID=UPI000C045855|nr:hypothetical protein [Xenorhabdus sp. KK7.4]PHM59274.1 hypothetical protein Xekk_00574 [Xenorhabdus sp. KK7.4]
MEGFEIRYPGSRQIYDSPSIEQFDKLFLSGDVSLWKQLPEGYICYQSPDKGLFKLAYIYCFDNSTVSMSYNINGQDGYFALANPDLINKFIDAHDENLVPLGSCVNLNEAHILVMEFLENPMQKPSHIPWISSDDVDYREFYELLGIDDD